MTKVANMGKITNLTRIKTQKEKKPRRAPKCPQLLQKSQSNKDFSCQLKTPMTNIAKNNKSNKNQDLERVSRSQEGPRNVLKCGKNRKSNKDFSCQLKTPMTNIAKIANITNVTKFQTQQEKKPRRAPKCSQISQK